MDSAPKAVAATGRRRQDGAKAGRSMSLYALQKLIRDVNRHPASREAYFAAPDAFAQRYELTAVAARSAKRIGLIATGGLSHDPGERNHGVIDTAFDHAFLTAMAQGNAERLAG